MTYEEIWIVTPYGNFYPGERCYAIATNGRAVGRHHTEVIEVRYLGVFLHSGNAAIEYEDGSDRVNMFGHLKLNRLRKKPNA